MSKTLKKIVSVVTGVMVALWLVGPSVTYGLTAEELQAQIDALLAQLAELQAQLAALQGEEGGVTGEVPAACTGITFDRNLKMGMTGDDVKCLQAFLNTDPETKVAEEGYGSPGNETSYFGPLTKAAVIKFQEKYAEDVLAPWGLTAGTGFVGSTTRAKLNELLTAAPAPTPGPETYDNQADCEAAGYYWDEDEGACYYEAPTSASEYTTEEDCTDAGYYWYNEACHEETQAAAGLTVALAEDTPAASSIAQGANTNFTKFTLTAGSEDVKISKIYVTRSGLSANSDVENIKIVEADTGVYRGSVGSLNVDNRAMITFTKKLVIPAGETKEFYIRAGATSGATSGGTIKLGIASASDIVSDAAEVSGDFPIVGNPMSVVALTIGTATVAEDGTTIDSKPDVGDTDVVVNKFKVSAGSTESLTIEQITVKRAGNADPTDTGNIELYDVTAGKSLGTVDNWDSEDKASWSNLDITIDKGDTHRFKVMVDILDGPGQTVNADLTDGSDVLMTVKGNTYGFYITPDAGSWDGQGSNSQTINSGALTVSKSSATPATGNISAGDDVTLGVFDFDAKGEDIKITAMTLDFTLGTMACSEVTNVKVYDEDGTIVAGPKDCSSNSVAYTDTFIVPVGVHQYTVKAKIADSVSTGDTIKVAVDNPSTSITATGMTSNNTITPSPSSDVEANTLTISAGSLTVTTLDTPAARNVAAGVTDFVWATAALDAGSSGEDVQVSTITITDTLGDANDDASTIDNAEIWADLTDASSPRGDAYETKVSDTEQPDDTGAATETHSFSLTQTITVPKGTFVKIALVADLNASATAGDTHTFTFSGVTATGATTGKDITESTSGSGQTMTVANHGTLTVTVDSSSPSASLLLDEETQTVAVFRLAADAVEDLDLDSIKITDDGADDTVDTYYFYSNQRSDGGSTSDPIGMAVGGATAEVFFADGTVTIPADDYVLITVKAVMKDVDGTVVQNGDTLQVTIANAGDVDTTGLASGDPVDSTDTSVDAAVHTLYESYPVFALDANSPSGYLTQSANHLAAIFDVTANGDKDITFENADGDQLSMQVTVVGDDNNGATSTNENIWIVDENGNTLATSSITSAQGTTQVDFDFSIHSWTIAAGQTGKLYVYVDTSDLEDDGDSLQIWLDDTAADCTFGINGSGAYAEGDNIFKGDIYAGTFVNPSQLLLVIT